jgi:hypothetical protein
MYTAMNKINARILSTIIFSTEKKMPMSTMDHGRWVRFGVPMIAATKHGPLEWTIKTPSVYFVLKATIKQLAAAQKGDRKSDDNKFKRSWLIVEWIPTILSQKKENRRKETFFETRRQCCVSQSGIFSNRCEDRRSFIPLVESVRSCLFSSRKFLPSAATKSG